jgi:hypothetical protein
MIECGASPGTIGAIPPLADQALQPHAAGVGVSHGPQFSSQARREVVLARGVTCLLLRLTGGRAKSAQVRSEDGAMLFDIGREQRPMQFVRWKEGCQ